jgi:hypothetical protein
MKELLLGELCVIKSVSDVDQKEMGQFVGEHFDDWDRLDCGFTVFSVQNSENGACNLEALS